MALSQLDVENGVKTDLLSNANDLDSRLVYETGDDGNIYAVEFSEEGEPVRWFRVDIFASFIDLPPNQIGQAA